MQRALRNIFPPQCITCGTAVEKPFSLCGPCWRETPVIQGLVCDSCGINLPGNDKSQIEYCDDCLANKPPWSQGRAALQYASNARKLVLALKHGDRTDLVKPSARMLLMAAKPLLHPETIIVPIPVYWKRLLQRRYNQAALLSNTLAILAGVKSLPDALVRTRATAIHDGLDHDARFKNMADAISPHTKRGKLLADKSVLLVDDVMTSGATFSAATRACQIAGATQVCVLALARVAKNS